MNNPLKFVEPLDRPGHRFAELLASYRSGEIDLKQGVFDSGGYCSLCRITSPDHFEKVTCAMCRRSYHTPCLHDKCGRASVATLARNPSLWWFCLECLYVSNSADVCSSGVETDGSLNVSCKSTKSSDPIIPKTTFIMESYLRDHLNVMESKIYSRLKSDLNESLSNINISNNSQNSSNSSDTMFPDFSTRKEEQQSTENLSANNSSDRSSRNYSSSSGFSESQGSPPSEQKTPPSTETTYIPHCFIDSRRIEPSKPKSKNSESHRKTDSPRQSDKHKNLEIPEIPRVPKARALSHELAYDPARVLSPSRFERRRQNADDLNEIRNLVQRGRNFDR